MYKEVIGNSIKVARKEVGLTQAQLAEAVNLSSNMIGNIERGEAYPSVEKLIEIYNVIQFPLDRIFIDLNIKNDNKIILHDCEKRAVIKLCEYLLKMVSESDY